MLLALYVEEISQEIEVLYYKACIGVKLHSVCGSVLPDLATSQIFTSTAVARL